MIDPQIKLPELLMICLLVLVGGCTRQRTQVPESADAKAASVVPAEDESPAETHSSGAAADFYTVADYDEDQDPYADLDETMRRATEENKRILLQVGGDWCGWCHRIRDFIETNTEVRKLIQKNFLVMKVTYPAKQAESFLSQYPKIEGYPHLFVLEADGTLLHSQDTEQLEQGEGYNQEAFCHFLASWAR